MFADRDLVDPSVADVAVDEFERIYRSAGARLAFLASARNDLPRPARSAAAASTRAWPTLEPPALFVWGSHDQLIPAGFSRHVERWLPARRADRARRLRPRAAGRAPERRTACSGASSRASTRSARRSARRCRAAEPPHAAPLLDGHGRAARPGCCRTGDRAARRRARRRTVRRRGRRPTLPPGGSGGQLVQLVSADPRGRPRRARPGLHPREPARACGCWPRCTSAPRSAAWATCPRRGRSCWSATTRAAT